MPASMHTSDLSKAEVSIVNDANSGVAVELPKHNYYTANGYHTFLLTTTGASDELILAMANKAYKVPAVLFANFTLLEYLNILAAGIGGVNILNARDVTGEAITGLTRLSRVSCGGNAYQVRKYLNKSYQSLHANVLNLISSGVNAYDYDHTATNLTRMQVITSEMAALTDILASVSKQADPVPITHVVQYLLSQMLTCCITVSAGVVSFDYTTDYRPWNAQPYLSHIDPAILLLDAEDRWYKTMDGARTCAGRFLSDTTLTAVIITLNGNQVARYDKQDGDVSVSDIYRRILVDQAAQDQADLSLITSDAEDLAPLIDTLDVNCYYPVDIPTLDQGADSSLIGKGRASCDPSKDTMIRYDVKSTIILPKTGSHIDSYPQLAANHLALQGMMFAHADGAADRTDITTAAEPLTSTAVYGKWVVSLRKQDDKTTEAYYLVKPNTDPDTNLDSAFKESEFYRSVLRACAGEVLVKDHIGTLDQPAVVMGSCCSQDTNGCGRVQLPNGSLLVLRPSPSNVILKYGTNVLDHAPEDVPEGFSPLPLSGTDETEHHYSPLYARLDDFLVDLVLTDNSGIVATQGTFRLSSWPRLAIKDVRDYAKLLTNQIKTASSDQAAGDAKIEDGSRIPRNWFEDFLSWFKDIFNSKWLWIIIAIIVVIILSRNSGGSGSSTTVILTTDNATSAGRRVSPSAESIQPNRSLEESQSGELDLI